ncbi:Cdc37 N terminal kinase binding-domain-containing protein [Epithele typhae]|uniref:Cdc37 N terminal kinase binding-domain-containing protein n=1 Tax=Epithele typhae TaxID=378194 RepID=UPI002008CBDC|nr:Cdc37 N terminal kinase binding-domain-containing protein [Epithele typhae]KAH9933216.1 Cdc37 N terminal kinase binding-domain-containing protein [Epithele typhae]
MPLNYSKWDKLELSDDSDIEGHPNVDKKSLVRWKQRAIHEQREERKHKIAQYKADIACNDVLKPRMQTIADEVAARGPPHFSALVEKFQTRPDPAAPPTNAPNQPTYDAMLLNLMLQVWEAAKARGVEKGDPKLGEALVAGLREHLVKIEEANAKLRVQLKKEEDEQNSKITSDDMHEGFDSTIVAPLSTPAPIKNAIPSDKPKKTVTEFENLNPKSAASEASAEEDETDLPELTPSLAQFSLIPIFQYDQAWEFIKAHRDVYVPGASDALLVAAFRAQSDGKNKYAKQCVHHSLLLQYCDKLGKDGPSVFFRKMVNRDARATGLFEKDVEDTYAHLIERVRLSKEEEPAGGAEQIQLVAENPETQISFNVPQGPPPEQLELEGPGFENVSVEEVRQALQMRWDVFTGFDENLQEAIKAESLEKINVALAAMPVDQAEETVKLLDMAGILSFAGPVRDETGRSSVATEDAEYDAEYEDEEEEGEGGSAAKAD